jgi:hypothetical protein
MAYYIKTTTSDPIDKIGSVYTKKSVWIKKEFIFSLSYLHEFGFYSFFVIKNQFLSWINQQPE